MVVPAPHGEAAKTLPMVRLAAHKLIVSIGAVVGVELLAPNLAGIHIATVLFNFVLAKHLQRLESFVTDITGVNPLSLSCALSRQPDPIQSNSCRKGNTKRKYTSRRDTFSQIALTFEPMM